MNDWTEEELTIRQSNAAKWAKFSFSLELEREKDIKTHCRSIVPSNIPAIFTASIVLFYANSPIIRSICLTAAFLALTAIIFALVAYRRLHYLTVPGGNAMIKPSGDCERPAKAQHQYDYLFVDCISKLKDSRKRANDKRLPFLKTAQILTATATITTITATILTAATTLAL